MTVPNGGWAWYHAFLTGPTRQLVAVIDAEVPMPASGLEIRTTGLWATHICETPLDHWTIGLEAFGLGVDDPLEIYGRQFGDRVPLGFDLEWEARTSPPMPATQRVTTPRCAVSRARSWSAPRRSTSTATGPGQRRWGPDRSWDARWFRAHGRLDDGTTFAASVVDGDLAGGRGSLDGMSAELVGVSETMTAEGLPGAARVTLGGLEIGLDPTAPTPLELADVEHRTTRAPRALCRCTTTDGRSGVGWAEWNLPRT